MIRVIRCLAIVLMASMPTPAAAQPTVLGTWDGAIHIMGQDLGIHVTFTTDNQVLKATIDIPVQGAMGLPLTNVKAEGESVHFELPAGPGLAVFDGTLKGDAISGSFTQGLAKGTFDLTRHKGAPPPPPAPEPPPPYNQEEVKIANGPITLAGTLTLPPSPGRHPAVVLITGSGAQNRDEELLGFKVFRVIADHLTRQGIAVLRCDDRGVGGSTGAVSDSTTEEFATDALAEVAFLKSRPDIDAGHIGLVGHSEGAIVASIAAPRSRDVAFIVLVSGSTITGEKILLLQGQRILKAQGASQEVLDKQADTQRRIFEVVRTNQGWDELEKQLKTDVVAQMAQLPDEQRKVMQQAADTQIQTQLKQVRARWFRFFLDFDPAPVLAQVRCPVLALFGELDLQVPVDVNKPVMEQAFAKGKNRDVTIKVLPKANHLYQVAKTGAPAEYASLQKEFVPELLPLLTTWIQQHVF